MTHFLSSDLWETRVKPYQENQGYNLRDSQGNLRNKYISDPRWVQKKCVLSYGIRDVTHFFSSEDHETRVQNDQQEHGYNLLDSHENLRNEHFLALGRPQFRVRFSEKIDMVSKFLFFIKINRLAFEYEVGQLLGLMEREAICQRELCGTKTDLTTKNYSSKVAFSLIARPLPMALP